MVEEADVDISPLLIDACAICYIDTHDGAFEEGSTSNDIVAHCLYLPLLVPFRS